MTPDEAKNIFCSGADKAIGTLLVLSGQVIQLEQIVEQLNVKIAVLSKNSRNSSKRPSSDDITKKPKENKRQEKDSNNTSGKEEKRKIGAQKGHPKYSRPLFAKEELDNTLEYHIPCCPHHPDCILQPTDGDPRIIQQLDIKTFITEKTEHISYPYRCNDCDVVHYADFPPNVVREGLFKTRITALVAYMKNVCHASFSTIRKFIRDVLGEKVSRGYLVKVIQKVGNSLKTPYDELLNYLPLEKTLNIDETGHKNNGDRFWTWVFKAELYVLFKIDKSRGSDVLIEVLGKEFNGVIGCDYFSAYRKYMKDFNVLMQFCIAHIIRDVKFLISLPDKESKKYGEDLLAAYKEIFKTIHDRETMDEDIFIKQLNKNKEAIINIAINEVPSCLDKEGKELKKHAKNMANRFIKHGEAYFQFITTPGMEPTNNIAEQAIRFVVIDRLVTQGTRSETGQRTTERLWSVIATCELQGRSAYEFILKAVEAYFNKTTAPSLLINNTS